MQRKPIEPTDASIFDINWPIRRMLQHCQHFTSSPIGINRSIVAKIASRTTFAPDWERYKWHSEHIRIVA